jgi:lipopolysaccharide heptosyltransferase II
MNLSKVKKILIVKLCCIGDVMFTTPLIRTLRKNFPQAEICYLVGKWTKDVLEKNPNINRVIIFDVPFEEKNKLSKLKYILKFIGRLRDEKFDLAINCHRSFASNIFLFLSRVKYRVGFNWHHKGFTLNKKINFDYKKHEVERYLDIARGIGLNPEDNYLEIGLSEEDRKFTEEIFLKFNPRRKKSVSVFPGGGVNPKTTMLSKRWPAENYAKLCDWIIEKYGAIVFFLGGKDDESVAEKIIGLMKNKAINLVGKTTFRQSAGIIESTSLFIGGDSGLLYIAAAVGTPTIALFGPSNPNLVSPLGEKHKYIWKKVECSPCYIPETVHKREFLKCNDYKCMKAITVNDVKRVFVMQWEKWVSN